VKNRDISATECPISKKIRHDDAERISNAPAVKSLMLKIQHGGRPLHLRDPFCIIIKYREFSIFKTADVRNIGFLKLNFLTVMSFRDTFCVIKPTFVRIGHIVEDIAIFSIFGKM